MAKELPKIKPCPWCKATGKVDPFGYTRVVICQSLRCGAAGPVRLSDKGAIEAWNRAPREGE